MRELDETDLEILRLLSADGRRSFASIGDAVGLSGPAVSDRVTRLEEAGVVRGFTVEVDRSKLDAGVPVLVRVRPEPDAVEDARERLRDAEDVDHVFLAADGAVLFYGRARPRRVRGWVSDLLEGVPVTDREVTLIDEAEYTPSVEGLDFALTCAECGNSVDSEGETARIGGDVQHFCCASCLTRFEQRYERLREGA